MIKLNIASLFVLLLGFLLLTGCAGTRTRPVSDLNPDLLHIPSDISKKKIAIAFDYATATINGMHHDGLFQVPQPWNFGPSDAQKHQLYSNLAVLATLSMTKELQRQGLRIDIGPVARTHAMNVGGNEWLISCKITSIELNTYGELAGDYWDALLGLQVQLINLGDGKVLWQTGIEEYAKLKPSPIIVDYMKAATMILPSITGGQHLQALMNDYSAAYNMENYQLSPVEVAARYAARTIINHMMKTHTK